MQGIAVLTSTRPVCRELARPGGGIPKRGIDARALTALGQKYGLVIIGSGSSDKVYDHIALALPSGMRQKFRLYSRSFFDGFGRPGQDSDQSFDAGWKDILKSNKIFFVTEREVVNEDFSTSFESFSWCKMNQFISDERVTVIVDKKQFMSV